MPLLISINYEPAGVTLKIDTGETLRIDTGLSLQLSLNSGDELDSDLYSLLKDESEFFESFARALSYISIRNRSEKEIIRYLSKKGFSESSNHKVVEKLNSLKYINDREFAENFIQYKRRRKPVGRGYLRNELYKKGIDRDIIDKSLRKFLTPEEEIEAALEASRKKIASIMKKKNPGASLYSFLSQRGFDSSLINKVMAILREEGYSFPV